MAPTFTPPSKPVGEFAASLLVSLDSGRTDGKIVRAPRVEEKNRFDALAGDEEDEDGRDGGEQGYGTGKRRKGNSGKRTYFAAPTFQGFGSLVETRKSGEVAFMPATFQVKEEEKKEKMEKKEKKALSAADWQEL